MPVFSLNSSCFLVYPSSFRDHSNKRIDAGSGSQGEEGLREGSLKRGAPANNNNEITEETVRQLQEEVRQLRQEIERMKKGASAQ